MTMVGSGTLLFRNYVSSMTGGCSCPIYYRGVVSLEKGKVIIRHKLPELIKSFLGGEPRGVEPCSSAAMFQA